MTRHLLSLVWNRKRRTALLLLEITFCFLVIFAVGSGGWTLASRWAWGSADSRASMRSLGFEWHDVWVVRLDLAESGPAKTDEETWQPLSRLSAELARLDGVLLVAAARTPPYSGGTMESNWKHGSKTTTFVSDFVSDDFARTLGLELVRGRWFAPEDDAAAVEPVVIDEGAATEMFDGAEPIGLTFDDGDPATDDQKRRVIGLVRRYQKDGELSAPVNMVFRRIGGKRLAFPGSYYLLLKVRPGVATADFEQSVSQQVRAFDPNLPFRVRPLSSPRKQMIAGRAAPALAGLVVALFLVFMVALGLTGVLWQEVTRRTREIGLRRALGASGGNVLRQILAETAILTSLAVTAGFFVIAQLPFFGFFLVIPKPAYLAGIALSLGAIYALTFVCALYPGWLASRLTPAQALRHD